MSSPQSVIKTHSWHGPLPAANSAIVHVLLSPASDRLCASRPLVLSELEPGGLPWVVLVNK
jgi:hypothetical protein